jgi:hypothetical protein
VETSIDQGLLTLHLPEQHKIIASWMENPYKEREYKLQPAALILMAWRMFNPMARICQRLMKMQVYNWAEIYFSSSKPYTSPFMLWN